MRTFHRILITLVLSSNTAQTTPVFTLQAYPSSPRDGESLTLSCQSSEDIAQTDWYSNGNKLITTTEHSIGLFNTSAVSRAFSQRISSQATRRQHNLTFLFNSSVDDRSVWNCSNGSIYSNNVTIMVFIPTSPVPTISTVPTVAELTNSNLPSFTTVLYQTTEMTEGVTAQQTQENDETSNVVYIATGVCSVLVIAAIIAVLMVLLRRKRRQAAQNQQSLSENETVYENKDGYEVIEIQNSTREDHATRTSESSLKPTPHQTRKQVTFVDDEYAQVDKTKKIKYVVEDSIESLYAKPIKNKEKTLSKASSTGTEHIDDTVA